MFDVLREIEEQLPWWLEDLSLWSSLYVNYHKPYVERVWRQYGDYRINLHLIETCEKSEVLYHPHPWPSVMRILSGTYEMDLGAGDPHGSPPPIASTLFLPTGTIYEMTEMTGWHGVRPLEGKSVSIMVSGKPWFKFKLEKPMETMSPLSDERKQEILNRFKTLYRKIL